jgi:hypothetical protein
MRVFTGLRLAGALLAAAMLVTQAVAAPLGDKPRYLQRDNSDLPNQAAVLTTLWAPGLDDGYVPQGLAILGDTVLISSYRSTDAEVDRGPCRVFAVSMTSGKQTGYFDVPEDCGHAGGLVMLDKQTLILADTKILFKIDLAKALEAKSVVPALLGTVRLKDGLKGSFVDFDGKNLWIGASEKTPEQAKAYRLPADIFTLMKGKERVGLEQTLGSIPIPIHANGMTFDRQGMIWLAASNSKYGRLSRIDPKDGKVLAEHDTATGIEDLDIDASGNLWAVSEAGSRRWSKWKQSHPIIFKINPSALK